MQPSFPRPRFSSVKLLFKQCLSTYEWSFLEIMIYHVLQGPGMLHLHWGFYLGGLLLPLQ